MSEVPPKQMDPSAFPYIAYGAIAAVSGFVSLLVAMIALNKFNTLTDSGMFAIALMIFAPGVMGIGISVFVYLTSKANPRQLLRARLDEPYPPSEGITTFPTQPGRPPL